MDPKELANRGKKAEAAIRDLLEDTKVQHIRFDYQRQLDARAAGGRFPSQTGDYLWFNQKGHGALEVKSVKHDFRLPAKNFGKEQIARLYRRQLASSIVVIAVHHSTTDLWRLPTFDVFSKNRTVPSWDLRAFPELDLQTVQITLQTIWLS